MWLETHTPIKVTPVTFFLMKRSPSELQILYTLRLHGMFARSNDFFPSSHTCKGLLASIQVHSRWFRGVYKHHCSDREIQGFGLQSHHDHSKPGSTTCTGAPGPISATTTPNAQRHRSGLDPLFPHARSPPLSAPRAQPPARELNQPAPRTQP